MDRVTSFAEEVPYQLDMLGAQRNAYEAVGLFAMDLLGTSSLAAGLACSPTAPASLSVTVGPGRIYSFQNLEPTAWGQFAGTGGYPADLAADHKILKQGLVRDTQTLALTPPSNPGQSICYLIQVGFSESDTAEVPRSFYNPADPTSPVTNNVSTARVDLAVVQAKAGLAATTGSQVAPAPDAGFVGVWVITLAYGQTTIASGSIAQSPTAPLVLTQAQMLALITARFGPTNPPAIADVTGLAAALAALTPGLAQGQIIGLGLSNTVGHTAAQVTASVGTTRDSTNSQDLVLAAPMTKDLTAVWASGTGNGGRDSATAVPVNSYYHVFLIWGAAVGFGGAPGVDVLFSQSATAPNLPAGYTKFRRIGSILTDATGAIRQFVQMGRRFELVTRTVDFPASTANGGNTPILRQLIGVPLGVKVRPIIFYQSTGTQDGTGYRSGWFDPDKGVPSLGGSTQWAQVRRTTVWTYPGIWNNYGAVVSESEACSASGQIYTMCDDATDFMALGCLGWVDDLGGFN